MRYVTQQTPDNRFTVIDTLDNSARLFPTCVLNATAAADTLNKQEAAYTTSRSR